MCIRRRALQAVTEYLEEVRVMLSQMPLEDIQQVINLLLETHQAGGKVFTMGNGGSAATASHFACDLAKGTITPGLPRFRVIALTDNVPLITVWGNDAAYEDIFAEQLLALVESGGVVIAIGASGNSKNVLKAVRVAKQEGAITIGLTGRRGGKLRHLVDVCVAVPSDCMERVEDAHLILEHLICTVIRQELQSLVQGWTLEWELPVPEREELLATTPLARRQ